MKHQTMAIKATYEIGHRIPLIIPANTAASRLACHISTRNRTEALFRRRAVYTANGCYRSGYRGIRGLVSR